MPDERADLHTAFHGGDGVTASPPGEWLVAERVEEAKRQLSTGVLGIDAVAGAVGMGTPDTLRHHFRKHVGVSSREYRARFGPADR